MKLITNLGFLIILAFGQSTLAKDTLQIGQNKANVTTLCHPPTTGSKTQYIIGYGSLMEKASKQRTAPDAGESLPIMVQGFERGWMIHGSIYSPTTFLAIVVEDNAKMNAVIYSVSEKEIIATDQREEGYCRILVAPSQVTLLSGLIKADAAIWVYAVPEKSVRTPVSSRPIVQSYVDIVIKGCLQLEKKFSLNGFANECVNTTSNWSEHWVNDRIFPRRPFIYEPEAYQIDKTLYNNVRYYFDRRIIPN